MVQPLKMIQNFEPIFEKTRKPVWQHKWKWSPSYSMFCVASTRAAMISHFANTSKILTWKVSVNTSADTKYLETTT